MSSEIEIIGLDNRPIRFVTTPNGDFVSRKMPEPPMGIEAKETIDGLTVVLSDFTTYGITIDQPGMRVKNPPPSGLETGIYRRIPDPVVGFTKIPIIDIGYLPRYGPKRSRFDLKAKNGSVMAQLSIAYKPDKS